MQSNLVYRNSLSSRSDSTLTSLGSVENLHSGTQDPFSSTQVHLNNNLVYGGRLEMLQQIANRVQRDCVAAEDKLVLAQAALQSDIKRFESGIQLQNEPEVAGYLLECENLLRQQVVDIQILLDGKFFLADHLVQRVSKIRDDLLALKAECSSVFSVGRSLSTEQTKMMISGITQSLDSGFSQNLNMGLSPILTPGPALSSHFTSAMTPVITPGLNPGMTSGLASGMTSGLASGMSSGLASGMTSGLASGMTSGLTSGLTAGLTPGITSGMMAGLTPGMQPSLRVGGSIEQGVLQHLKHMQIRKPMLKSSLVDSSLTEEEVNMKFVEDLLNWVEEMQVQVDQGEWGSDLPSVESHLDNHRHVHRAIEDFHISIKEAKLNEVQMTHPLKLTYSEKLGLLDSRYGRLLNSSKERQRHLDSLHDFVARATLELIWLNEKEEEEVAFDWSERNSHIIRKKEYHAELMRELDEKEGVIKSVQDQADSLLQQLHPARLTIEAYRAAMQTQWSWVLQLCHCVEQHLKENTVYFEFFNDAKESMDFLKSLQDSISRKYACDRTSSQHRLEDLIQESMDEKEQLLQYRSTVASLVGRAKSVVQLKPRNPESPVRTSIPVKAICDYRQIEITIYKDDECVLANNTHRAKWKVISPSGNEAMVPAVCFTVPPPNKEAFEIASKLEQLYQNVLALWHRSHINMKSVVSWHYLMTDIRNVRKCTVSSVKTMLPGEHQQILQGLQTHFDEFLEDSEESEIFTMSDRTQLEKEVLGCREYYEEMLKSAEREEQEESVYNIFIADIRNFRMRVEAHEEHLIRQVRSALERDDLKAIMQRITEQERKIVELDRLNQDLVVLKEKCEVFLRQVSNSPLVSTLSSELNVLIQGMTQIYSMCSIYLDKLRAVSLVIKNSQSAEALVKMYEAKLCDEDAISADIRSIDTVMATLKQWRSEIDDRREVFHELEDELQKARVISERMFKSHNERDFDLDWHKEKAEQLGERWRNVHLQIENRLRDLEAIIKSLKYYRDSYISLDEWIRDMESWHLKAQENQADDSKSLAELLNQQKMMIAEIESKQSKIDECQKYSEQYLAGVKDYELQLMTYRAIADSQHKSPVKRRRIQSSSDNMQLEFMDLRTRYTALLTLMTQYVRFAGENLRRTEDDEKRTSVDKAEYRCWMESVEHQKSVSEEEVSKLKHQILELEASLADRQKQLDVMGGDLDMQKKTNEELNIQKSKAEYETKQFKIELETAVKTKGAVEQELAYYRQLIQQAEAKQHSLEESLRRLKKSIEEGTLARRKLEDHLRRKSIDVQDLEEHSRSLERELKAKEEAEAELLNQVRFMEKDFGNQPETRMQLVELRKENIHKTTSSSNFLPRHSEPEVDVMHCKVEELMVYKTKAETEIKSLKSELNSLLLHKNMAEEKAQHFKELLDDANGRLMNLQTEIESDRNNIRHKSDEYRQEAAELKKSVYVFQEQIKSLQRDKASLEQRVLFHKTEVDGLKEQLKTSQGKLLQRSTSEQESCQKMRNLEEELSTKHVEAEQMRYKMNELTRSNQMLEGDVRHLTVSIESFQQEKKHLEQKINTIKKELEDSKEQLQKAKDELSSKTRIEKDMQLKVKNLELELQKNDLQVSQLTKKIDERSQTNLDTERSMKNLKTELDRANMELESKDQQISIFRSQAESTKSQIKIIEEDLLKKTQTSHELQLKVRDYNEQVKKTSEYEQKFKSLTTTITNYETEIQSLKAELSSICTEKNLANQKVQEYKMEINNLNQVLQKASTEAQKESAEGKKNMVKLRELENELSQCKQTISRMTGTSEKTTVNLKQDISTLQREKQAVDQKLQALKTEFDQLNSTLKRTKDDLQRVTQEGKTHQSKLKEMEAELQKNKMTIKEMSSNSDTYTANIQQQYSTLLKEKSSAEEKITTLTAETSQLKMRMAHTQEELMQKQKETSAAKLRSQMLEDQLEQKVNAMKNEVDSAKEQLQKTKEELSNKLKIEKDMQMKVKNLELELQKNDLQASQLTKKIDELNKLNLDNERSIKNLKSELDHANMDLVSKEQQISIFKLQSESTKSQIKIIEEDLIKKNQTSHELHLKVRDFNEQVKKTSEYEQKFKSLNTTITTYETEIRTLKAELSSISTEKNLANQRVQEYKMEITNLNQVLQKASTEAQKDSTEGKKNMAKLRELENELSQCKQTISRMTETSEKSTVNLKQDITTLQREKQTVDQKLQAFKTEFDQLNSTFKRTKEELQRVTQEGKINLSKLKEMETELQKNKLTIKELNTNSDKYTTNLQQQYSTLLKEKSFAEEKLATLTAETSQLKMRMEHTQEDLNQKVNIFKNEVENLKEQLRKAKEELSSKTRTERDSQIKAKNLELELQKNDLQVSKLTKKIDELNKLNLETERSMKTLKAELDRANMDLDSKDQEISIFKLQSESTKSQIKIIEEELLKKTQTSHEFQLKVRDYNEQVKKTSEYEQKFKSLSTSVMNYETEIQSLKSELVSISTEKNLANQKVQEYKVEINNLNQALQKATTEAQKELSEGKKNVAKLRELENELSQCKQTISRMTGTSEKTTVNLKQDITTLQREKQALDHKLQALKIEFDQLNSTFKRTKEELQRVTQDGKTNQSKLREMETELQKNKMTIKEISSNSDTYTTNLQQQYSTLLKEKSSAEEKITTLTAETSHLKMRMEHTQEELMQKQKETSAAKLRSQMLEDQLENCKRMLEDLKGKLDLQKKGYETQLKLLQTEMEQKLALQESRMKFDYDRKSKNSAETIERDNKQFVQEIEKMKTLHLKAKQDAQQQMDSLNNQLEQSRQQKATVDLELLKAKSKITELETEKIRVKSTISQMDSVRKESSEETSKLKQMLAEIKQRMEISENEAKCLKEQIASYVNEVKILQEKNLKLEVNYSTEMKRLKKMEDGNQASHKCAKDEELAKLKNELMLKQKILLSFEEAKLNLEEELQKMTSEIVSLKNETQPGSEDSLRITENSGKHTSTLHQFSTSSTTSQMNVSENPSMARKSSLSDKVDKGRSGKTQSVTFNLIGSESSNEEATDLSNMCESFTTKVQSLRGRISIKKLIKTKIITVEMAYKLKSGLITMDELQASLAQFSGKPLSIAGIYLESSKKKISFMQAAEAGLMAKTYAIEFLEAQAGTGAIIDPNTGESYSASEALEKGIIDADLRDKILDADKAVSGFLHAGKLLSVFQAMEERIVDRHRGKAILEAQLATGGLIHPLIGMRVPLENAIEQGLINQATYQTLYDPVSNPKSFHNPETRQRAYYGELLKLCVYDVNGGVYLLPIGESQMTSFSPANTHRVSVINSASGIEKSAYDAYKSSLIDLRIYLFLSQQDSDWQETTLVDATGNPLHILIDKKSGRQFCLEIALSRRILQTIELQSYRSGELSIYELADLLISRNVVFKIKDSPIAGLWDVTFKRRLSVFKGLQQNLVDRLTAVKLLEAQACTGGICDPASGERVQITEALRRGLLDDSFIRPLQQFEQAFYGIVHPKTRQKISIGQAMQENLFPKDAGLRCLEFQLVTGGLIEPDTGKRVLLEEGVQKSMIDKATALHLKDEHSYPKNITCPKTKRKISFKEALEKGVYDSHTGLLLLDATKHHSTGATTSFQYYYYRY